MKPSISVIIPVYNRAHLVERTLDSVWGQSYRPIQLIVVDNASSDNSLSTVRRWATAHTRPDFEVIVKEEHKKGATEARQTGLASATSPYTLFFDSDDVMKPDLIAEVMARFSSRPDTEIVYWQTAVTLPDGSVHPKRFSTRNLLRRHLFNAMFCTQSYAATTDFFRKCGWDTTLSSWNDWELGLRMLLEKPKLCAIAKPLVVIYPQAESITGTDFKSKHGEWEKAIVAMEKVSDRQPQPLCRRLKRMLLYRRVILAAIYTREGAAQFGHDLLQQSLAASTVAAWRKWLLHLIYHYTRLGGRAAYILWR